MSVSFSDNVTSLGGHGKDGKLECNEARCPEFDEMVIQNDGQSFQRGCGWDVLETGCCFMLPDFSYSCFRCEQMLVGPHNATCKEGWLKQWTYESVTKVPLSFKTPIFGEILHCGPNLNPDSNVNVLNLSATSSLFLCNQFEWVQGDFIDDAGLGGEPGIGSDFGLKSGRHVRVNYNNYQQSEADNSWIQGQIVKGN